MHSSQGSQRRGGHVVIGLALLVMGYAVLVIAFARQAERARGADLVPACVGSTDVTHGSAPGAAAPGPTSIPMSTGLTSAAAPGDASAAATSGGGLRDAGRDGAADAEADIAASHDFWFFAGTLAMTKEERQRLVSLGVVLAHRPDLRVTVEGFSDQGTTDTDAAALARKRAAVGKVLLARAGVAEARIVLAVGDAATEPRLARAIHVTTASAPVEVDP